MLGAGLIRICRNCTLVAEKMPLRVPVERSVTANGPMAPV